MNKQKIIFFSILAMGFLALTYIVDWIFIAGAIALVYYNQKEILKNKNSK